MLQIFHGMLKTASTESTGADDETTVGNGFGDGLEFYGLCKERRGTDGGARFAEGGFVGVNDAEVKKTEIAHGPGGGADVKRIARGHKDDAKTVGFGFGRQGRRVYNRNQWRIGGK